MEYAHNPSDCMGLVKTVHAYAYDRNVYSEVGSKNMCSFAKIPWEINCNLGLLNCPVGNSNLESVIYSRFSYITN